MLPGKARHESERNKVLLLELAQNWMSLASKLNDKGRKTAGQRMITIPSTHTIN